MLRSVLAVLAGYAAMAAIVIVSTVLAVRFILRVPASAMRSMEQAPPSGTYLTANIVASALAALIGGRITGAIASQAPMTHGLALAALMVAFGLLSARRSGAAQPRWYRTLLVTLMPAVAIAGAALAT
ncbi:MAG: hypothetical protein ACREL2_02660 [Gemmatimonadales bacterium]